MVFLPLHNICLVLLLENLQKLDQTGKPIEVRIPLIPDYNSTPEALAGFAAILGSLKNLTAVTILPFHHARFKYQALDITEPLAGLEPCSDETAFMVKKFFTEHNIKVSENYKRKGFWYEICFST